MKLNLEEFGYVKEASDKHTEHNYWVLIEDGDWIQDGKDQVITRIVKDTKTDLYYSYTISRSGSPFTDWYYPYKDSGSVELEEVVKVSKTVVIEEWVRPTSIPKSTYIEAEVGDYETFRIKLPDGFYEKHSEDLEKALNEIFLFEWYYRGCLMNEEEYFQVIDMDSTMMEEKRDEALDMIIGRCEDMGLEKLESALKEIF